MPSQHSQQEEPSNGNVLRTIREDVAPTLLAITPPTAPPLASAASDTPTNSQTGLENAVAAAPRENSLEGEMSARDLKQLQSRIRRHRYSLYLMFSVFFGILTIPFLRLAPWYIFPFLPIIALFALLAAQAANKKGRKALIELAKSGDVRAVGSLVDSLKFPDWTEQADARMALTTLLPRLQTGDGPLLNSRQRHILHSAVLGVPGQFLIIRQVTMPTPGGVSASKLGKNDHAPVVRLVDYVSFILAVFKAFEQIGNATDLAAIEKIARRWSRDPRDLRVRKAAESCVESLRQRLAREHAPDTLLRAADSTGLLADELLRPAQDTSSSDPNSLLRASTERIGGTEES